MLRGDLQNKMEQIRYRLASNVMVQEGDEPNEDPNELLKEYDRALEEFGVLVKRINKTNNETDFSSDLTLSEALVERDILKRKRNLLASAVEEGTVRQDRYSRTELRYVSKIDVNKLQKQMDDLSKDYRELDVKIQGLNWTVDLL